MLAGDAMYRDIFDLTTPGWQYLIAALFRLFGTTLWVARTAVAVMHGLSSALTFVVCRRLGVRIGLAGAAALGYLVLAQTGCGTVVLSGGVAANVKMNQRIHEMDEVERTFIYPNMGHGGCGTGLALLWDSQGRALPTYHDVYYGPSWAAPSSCPSRR